MALRNWQDLPASMQTEQVRYYYDRLIRKKSSLVLKRAGDVLLSGIMLIILSPFFLVMSLIIKLDSPGPVFFRQIRITQYGKEFRIFKFRTMVQNADRMGTQVTVKGDQRITRVGSVIRKYRIDEISQLLNIFNGTMTFVGTRPEVPKYVEQYTDEMMATLLLPAGVTSNASISYKDEDRLLAATDDVDRVYVDTILPEKMKYNLRDLRDFSIGNDIKTIFRTVKEVI